MRVSLVQIATLGDVSRAHPQPVLPAMMILYTMPAFLEIRVMSAILHQHGGPRNITGHTPFQWIMEREVITAVPAIRLAYRNIRVIPAMIRMKFVTNTLKKEFLIMTIACNAIQMGVNMII